MLKRSHALVALVLALLTPIALGALAPLANASSHREAPLIANDPAADNTDFYMFRSPEDMTTGQKTVTFLANYNPLQAPSGGPNFHHPADDVLHSINIDNDGDAEPDYIYQFRFRTETLGFGGGKPGDTYLYNAGPINALDDPNLLVRTYYTVTRIVVDPAAEVWQEDGIPGQRQEIGAGQVAPAFVGRFSYCPDQNNCTSDIAKANYQRIAASAISGTADHVDGGRVWVGPRQEAFYVDLGKVFDLARLAPLNPAYGQPTNYTAGFNVTSIALKVPVANLINSANGDPVVGAWATASRRSMPVMDGDGGPGPYRQVSRLGNPLVNEVVIGRADKDKFNASAPKDDVANFGGYVLQPRIVAILNLLYKLGLKETNRADLVQIFVTGIPTVTRSMTLTVGGEMLRLNTAVDPKAPSARNDLGVIGVLPNGGGIDPQGFPNGRRPTDDVTDIELSALTLNCSGNDEGFGPGIIGPNGIACTGALVGDGVGRDGLDIGEVFPYLPTPLSGNN